MNTSSIFYDVISVQEIISLQDGCPADNAHSYAALLPSARSCDSDPVIKIALDCEIVRFTRIMTISQI